LNCVAVCQGGGCHDNVGPLPEPVIFTASPPPPGESKSLSGFVSNTAQLGRGDTDFFLRYTTRKLSNLRRKKVVKLFY